MTTSNTPRSWSDVMYGLQDSSGNPARDVLALPVHGIDSAKRRPAPIVSRLCTLPPAKLGQRIPPNVIERYDGCSPPPSLSGIERMCQALDPFSTKLKLPFRADCAWRALTDSATVDPFHTGYCLPLDDPVLADRGIVPVPMLYNSTLTGLASISYGPELENRIIPTLKHFLESRNHPSLAAFPAFANVAVRASHKRLRLGVCTTFPPVNSPCSLDAVDNVKGTIAPGWLFPSPAGNSDPTAVLARPQSAFTSMVGPLVNTLDASSSSSSSSALAPPFPFLAVEVKFYRPNSQYNAAWSSPLIKCAATSNTTRTASIGAVRPLLISGPCASNRDCLSGVCMPQSNTCDHESRNHDTDSPFSPSFIINATTQGSNSRFLTYPPTESARGVLESLSYSGMSSRYLPSGWVYHTPVIVVGSVIVGILFVALIWMRVVKFVKRVKQKWTGWRSTTERDIQLKPVSGAMVGDVGDELAVREAVEAGEELPVYVSAETIRDE